ncbi:hypothetical protein PSECIP111951_02687 [Pseudoalteromonas holothuriae]|uniref:DUF4097 domain-containing protein n=1 Tax=Pseudoalteromonas holothuriae TaxID=2963714 RepID=A0A9W4QVC7_9GAMM|nr:MULTISPECIES: DUF4097 family beta strand repeat-containing protein [unclassified Pseudoalteromonas]CAH9054884.1 hypothetical protein PSECIP111854_01465 [Pseudoalteromonas sp. CIP111854]CAH9062427.1 hypothetical protein PSECIP111951_02687 [Pseudoalteromonas sp. CIP111951]
MRALLAGLALLPVFAFATQKIDEQITIPVNGKVVVENQRGEITIKTWDENSFKVSGTLDEKAKGYKLETNGSVTEFIVQMPKQYRGWKNARDGSILTIYMPKSSELNFEGVSVDIKASELHAGTYIKTVKGNIKASDLKGKISLQTINGDIDGLNLNGNIHYETVNGEINDRNSAGKLKIDAVNGDIESDTSAQDVRLENVNGEVGLRINELAELRLNTVNGEIDVRIKKLKKNANINMDTVSGDVSLYLPANVSARFDIDMHAGGNVINELSEHEVKKSKWGPSRELEFVLNGGDADIEIDTVSGHIELKKN